MERYKEYKDSGISWIGKFPKEWAVGKLKHHAQLAPHCCNKPQNPETEIEYTPMEYIKQGYFIPNSSRASKLPTSLTEYEEGDIVMAKVTPCFENGNIAIMEGLRAGFGVGSSELFVIRPRNIDSRFLLYILQNRAFVEAASASMTGAGGLKRVSPVFIKNAPICYPDSKTQQEIAAYLDSQLTKIQHYERERERAFAA